MSNISKLYILIFGWILSLTVLFLTIPSYAQDESWPKVDSQQIVNLGSIEGWIGGGQFIGSSEIPTGIYFSYGYSDAIWSDIGQVYVFDDFVIPESGITIDIFENDDPEFSEIINAIKNGPPSGSAFYTAFGFHPVPPFHKRGVYYNSSPITVSHNSHIEFLRLTLDPFTITSTVAPGNETLWEIPMTHFKITAFGQVPDIVGRIETEGKPLVGATIILRQRGRPQRTTTDAKGEYQFDNVRSGPFTIEIRGRK